MKPLYTILLLITSNIFMTLAWYGHLKWNKNEVGSNKPLLFTILLSWGFAFFEYCFMIPANKYGFQGNGGYFSLLELKVIQEVISISVFVLFAIFFFKSTTFSWNHIASFFCLVLAVYFAFRK